MKRRSFFRTLGSYLLAAGASGAVAQSSAPAREDGDIEITKLDGKLQSAYRFCLVFGRKLTFGRGPHLFSDWRWVAPGDLVWRDSHGAPVRLYTPGPFADVGADHDRAPQGIVIRAQAAEISDPVEKVWPGTVIYEDGQYRLWYAIHNYRLHYLPEFVGKEEQMDSIRSSWIPVLLYAESNDGFHWTLPRAKVNVGDYPWSNGVFAPSRVSGEQNMHQPGVFRDPSGPAEERYKMVYGAEAALQGAEAKQLWEYFRTHRPNDLDPGAIRPGPNGSMDLFFLRGATSPDGCRWTPIKQPLALHNSDTGNTAYYDEVLKKYVWYGRVNSYFWRRAVGRAETADFSRFPFPDIVIRPVASDAPSMEWYTNAKTLYPGTTSEHFMFPTKFRQDDQSGLIYLFSSPDGIHWDQAPEGPVIVQGPHGRPEDTWIRAWGNLVPLSTDRVGLMCEAELLPHKYPRSTGQHYREVNSATTFWASWPKGRLSAIEADDYGSFETPPLHINGKRLVLNVATKRAGEVLVEVARHQGAYPGHAGQTRTGTGVSPSARPSPGGLPGRNFTDCDPIRGDSLAHTVTWRGNSEIEIQEDVVFRFRMRMAKLFSFEIV